MLRFSTPLPALLLASLLTATFVHATETLRLRADVWMPYNGEPEAALPGYAIEIARSILARHDITLDYQNSAWDEALSAAREGQIDAVIGANRDEADGLVLPQERIGEPRVGFYVRKGNDWRYENVGSLRSVRLGVIAGYKYWPALDSYIAKHAAPKVIAFSGENPLQDALAQLDAGKIDVLAETSSVFAWAAKNAGYAATSFRPVYLHEGDPVYFAFSPRGEVGSRYAKLFDDGLREMRRNGELTRILTRYGLSDWQ